MFRGSDGIGWIYIYIHIWIYIYITEYTFEHFLKKKKNVKETAY